jgi:hypothetical protein
MKISFKGVFALVMVSLLFAGCAQEAPSDSRSEGRIKSSEAPQWLMSNGTTAFQTYAAGFSGRTIQLENGAVLEVDRDFGVIEQKADAVLYIKNGMCTLWISGVSGSCTIRKPPEARGEPAKEVQISEVKNHGLVLFMSDGSVYEVHLFDQFHASLWQGGSKGLVICDTALVNFREREIITVHRIQ